MYVRNVKELSVKFGGRSKWSCTKKHGQENTSRNNKQKQQVHSNFPADLPRNFTVNLLTSRIHRRAAKSLQDGGLVFGFSRYFRQGLGSALEADILASDRALY